MNALGDKVEILDDKTEVTHPDGTKEEIEDGRLEVNDASGRTIVDTRGYCATRSRCKTVTSRRAPKIERA